MFCPRGQPTGNSRRESPQAKALASTAVQFGPGNPFKKQGFGLAAAKSAILRGAALQKRPGVFRKRVNRRDCHAADTVASGVTEVLLVDALNDTNEEIQRSGWLEEHHPELLEVAADVYWEHKPIQHNEADFFMVRRQPDNTLQRFGCYQQTARFQAVTSDYRPAGRAAMLVPIDPGYVRQAAAEETGGVVVFVHHSIGVGAGKDVAAWLDARAAAGGGGEEEDEEEDMEEVEEAGLLGLLLPMEEGYTATAERQAAAGEAALQGAAGGEEGEEEAPPAQQQQQQPEPQQELAAEAGSSAAGGQGEAGSDAGPGSSGGSSKAVSPTCFRYSHVKAAGAVVDCSEPEQLVVEFLRLLKEGKITPQDPQRSLDQGLPAPAVLRNPKQCPTAKAVLKMQDELAAALDGRFTVHANLAECTAPGVYLVPVEGAVAALPAGQQQGSRVQQLQDLLRLGGYRSADVEALGALLAAASSKRELPAVQLSAAALGGSAPPPGTWEDMRQVLLPAEQGLFADHIELARQSPAAAAGAAAAAAAAATAAAAGDEEAEGGGRKRTRSGAGFQQGPPKKTNADWTAQMDTELRRRLPECIRESKSHRNQGELVVDFKLLGQKLGCGEGAAKRRWKDMNDGFMTPPPGSVAFVPLAEAPDASGSGGGSEGGSDAPAPPAEAAAGSAAAAGANEWQPGRVSGRQPFPPVAVPGLLEGQKALFLRVATISPDGTVDLTHSLAGADYSMRFDQLVIRWQGVLAVSPQSGRTYAASTLQLHFRGALGTVASLAARGNLQFSEASLAPFEVTSLLGNCEALASTLLPLLMPAEEQAAARSAVGCCRRLARLGGVSALHDAGASPFDAGWSAGICRGGTVNNYALWSQTQAARGESVEEALSLAAATGLADPMHLFGAMNYSRTRAKAAGVQLSALLSARQSIEQVAQLHYDGNVALAREMRDAEDLLAELAFNNGVPAFSAVKHGREDWAWVNEMEERGAKGLKEVIEEVRYKCPNLGSKTALHYWEKYRKTQPRPAGMRPPRSRTGL